MPDTRPIHPGNFQTFCEVYLEQLTLAVQKYPAEYPWFPREPVETVAARMFKSFQKGTFNKDSKAIKATCKALGIAHTYKAIKEFIR